MPLALGKNRKTFILLPVALLVALSVIYVFAHNYKAFRGRGSNNTASDGAQVSADNQRPLGDLPSPANSSIRDLVVFPNAAVELIAGPQLKSGSRLNPFPRFDSIAATRGMRNAQDFPSIPPMNLSGAISITRGSTVVTGTGTRFTSQVDPRGPAPLFNGRLRIRDRDGTTMRVVQVLSVQSDTQMTLNAPWAFESISNTAADTDYNDQDNGWAHDAFINKNYYDLALCLYQEYYRTGDQQFLREARRIADSWWKAPFCKEGTERSSSQWPQPRSISLGGLMLRALDGRPEMWDWINFYVRYQYDAWVMAHLNSAQLFGGAREAGYLLLYAAWLSRVLPNSFPLTAGGVASNGAILRAGYLSDVERAAVSYYARLQYPDGSWRWDDPYEQADDGGSLKGIMQPFMVGLLLEGMVAVDRVTTNQSVKSVVEQSIIRSCYNLYNITYRRGEAVSDLPGKYWRAQWYYYYGGTTVHPTWFEHGGTDQGASLPNKAGSDGAESVSFARHMNSTLPQAFGYAYAITGDEKYKRWGEDIMDASFGMSDGMMGIADSPYSQPKAYTMNYRASGKFLAWRLNSSPSPNSRAVNSDPGAATQSSNLASPELISSVFDSALVLSASSGLNETQIKSLMDKIEAAIRTFSAERGQFVSPDSVLAELQSALSSARIALQAARAGGASDSTAKLRLEWTAARLKRANDLAKPKPR
ncbi:MAG TPA: hypothetical protein VK619_07810 [Pyrinomonadaceae bacterium]|nr:hypothetical protein [Pyrinomonadaceae bacterium]